jgi:hypothetical protein
VIARIVACMCLLCAVACGQPTQQAPPSQDPRFGAPSVSSPRDVRSLSADPCRSILTPPQWRALGFDPTGEPVTLPTGEGSCEWRGPDREPYVNVGVAARRDILVDTYRVRQFRVFRPASIGGLPAVVEKTAENSFSCNVTVGTAEGQGFLAIYDGSLGSDGQADDPCRQAQDIAQRIVASLPPLPGK